MPFRADTFQNEKGPLMLRTGTLLTKQEILQGATQENGTFLNHDNGFLWSPDCTPGGTRHEKLWRKDCICIRMRLVSW
jgi:hypothetical protein